jgi:UV DNA damage endonuclease
MKIGYACLVVGVPHTNFRTCTLRYASEDKFHELIEHNLKVLDNIINYNIANNIHFFRITSSLIPFASSPINAIKWWEIYKDQFKSLGQKLKENNIRATMHPGQYTVLNSPKEDVYKKAIKELEYHNQVLNSLGTSRTSKMILHIGGVYNDKALAIERFIKNFLVLDKDIKSRLVIENDDKSYNIKDVLDISKIIGVPVVFDNLHNQINPSSSKENEVYWINKCKKTWKKTDGVQKIHYSEQDPLKHPGSHSQTINEVIFGEFVNKINRDDIDIMLEVKDKNISTVKCIQYLNRKYINL